MAEIQIVYRTEKCVHENELIRLFQHCGQCHTIAADAIGCDGFHRSDRGDCANADFATKYAGGTVKKYKMEPYEDEYNPWLNCMIVKANGKKYECTKVILNGELIYQQDEDGNQI